MGKVKTLQELTIKDNFMFAAVMMDPKNCRGLLEMLLRIPIDHVEVDAEKSIVYNPEYHGIRLDIFARDENMTRYSVEMQVRKTPVIKRSRYYHSDLDMSLLLAGASYDNLPDTYVIFICDYAPFENRKYCYTVRSMIEETGEPYDDGNHTMILSTRGENRDETASELVKFLDYVHAELDDSRKDFNDQFVRQLQASVEGIKASREMEMRYMVLERLISEERQDAREEGRVECRREDILKILSRFGRVSEKIEDFVQNQTDMDVLEEMLILAINAASLDEFIREAKKYSASAVDNSEDL